MPNFSPYRLGPIISNFASQERISIRYLSAGPARLGPGTLSLPKLGGRSEYPSSATQVAGEPLLMMTEACDIR